MPVVVVVVVVESWSRRRGGEGRKPRWLNFEEAGGRAGCGWGHGCGPDFEGVMPDFDCKLRRVVVGFMIDRLCCKSDVETGYRSTMYQY